MNWKLIFVIILIIQSVFIFAQKENRDVRKIRKTTYKINSLPLEFTNSQFKLDSIDISIQSNKKLIITNTIFDKSNSKINIKYYFDEGQLILLKFEENSPKYPDLNRYTEFYYKKGKLVFTNYYHSMRICMAFPLDVDFNELYGYNKNLDSEFLKKLSDEILTHIKN